MKKILFFNTIQDKAWRNRALFLMLALVISIGNAWAFSYYSKVSTAANPTAAGKVYVVEGEATVGTATSATNSGSDQSQTYSVKSVASAGYYFSSWSGTGLESFNSTSANPTTCTILAKSRNEGSPTTGTATGNFTAITVSSVSPAPLNLGTLTSNSSTGEGLSGNLTFTSSHAGEQTTAAADFNAPTKKTEPSVGTATIGTWTASGTTITVPVTYKGNGTSWGGTNRTVSFTVYLESKGDTGNGKTATVTASYPNAKITSGSTEEIYATFKTADATQAGVERTAVFNVEYVDGTDNFDTPSITGTDASYFTYNSMSYADGKLTVTYTYNGNKTAGDHTATLTLKVNDAIGGTDATYGSKSVTLVAHNEQEADYDVEVYNASGTKISDNTTMWADGLTLANANEGSTIKLMRNIDEINTLQTITKSVTIDLNGKTISGTGATQKISSTTYYTLFYCGTAGKTITIKDSKTGGKIKAIRDLNARLYTFVSYNGNHIVLQSGTVESENTGIYNSSSKKSVGTCPIYVKTKSTFTQDGGVVSSIAGRNAYGVIGEANATTHSTITLNAGEIKVSTPVGAYGVVSTGEINIHEGAIVNVRTESVNGVAGGSTAYGIQINASANATDASSYYGTLNMDGGTIRVFTTTTTCYGILVQGVTAAATSATDGTHSNKATPHCNITGGSIDVYSTSTTAQGIQVIGDTNTKTGEHVVAQIKNCNITVSGEHPSAGSSAANIYGVYVHAVNDSARLGLRQGDVELTNCNVTATARKGQNAVAVYIHAVQFSKLGDPYKEEEVATAGKVTINSGTYTAETSIGRYAYAVQSAARVKSVLGTAEAYPTVIIHGGTFTTTSGTTDSYAVYAGGNTTIDGGTFNATSGSSNAIGINHRAGKLIVSGVRITSHATTSLAYGIYLTGAIHDYTGYAYASDAELNNIDATVTTGSGSNAYGVWLNAIMKSETQARYDTYMAGTANAVTKSYYDRVWSLGGHAIAPKVTINGGTYKVTSATSTAYGAWSKKTAHPAELDVAASPEMTIKNATFNVTATTSTAGGVLGGGPVTVDNCDITVKATTETAYGVLMDDKTGVVSNSTINVTTPTKAYGLYANSPICTKVEDCWGALGIEFVGKIESNNNTVTAKATGGNTAYGIYVHSAKAATASGPLAGDHAIAATATINGGKYTAKASGTTAYAVHSAAKQTQGEKEDAPSITINGGKFWAEAPSKYADISSACVPGYCVIKGGYYKNDANIDARLEEGYNKFALKTNTQEYSEGYRWRVTNDFKGEVVCKVTYGSTTKEYDQLESAFKYVNDTMENNTAAKIILCANYILSAGNYTIPSGVTLLIPYDGTNTSLTKAQTESSYNAIPSCYRKLTMPNGAHIIVEGDAKLEVGGVLNTGGQTNTAIGAPRAHGKIRMANGSSITLENKSHLYCWGYIVGAEDNSEGTILAKEGSTVHEGLQIRDWKGGKASLPMQDNNKRVFPIHQYYLQNIETPITFEYGSNDLITTGMRVSLFGTEVEGRTDDQIFISSTGGLFNFKSSDATLVRDYDEKNDRIIYNISGSSFSFDKLNLNLKATGIGVDIKSENYVLPITNNMTFHIKAREFNVGAEVFIAPGAELYIEEGSNVICNKNIYVLDKDDWVPYQGVNIFPLQYANETDYRSKPIRTWEDMQDAKICVNGTIQIDQNLYTSNGKANICSTGKGVIVYKGSSPQANSTMYMVANATNDGAVQDSDYTGVAVTAAQLHNDESKPWNQDEKYTPTAGAVAGDEFVYSQYYGKWLKNPKVITWDATTNGGTCETPQTVLPQQETKVPELPIATKTGYTFNGWFTAASGGDTITTETDVDGDVTYYAQFEFIEVGPQLDIVDADNTEQSLTINATSFALSGWPYTINDVEYARPADRMLTIPYGDKDPNAEIVIEVKDKEGTVVSYNMYIVPFVYTSDATLSGTDENSIVFVKSGTLTVGDASAKEIYVAPGAALQVNENGTLDVKKLVLRTTPFEAAILTNKGTIVGQVYYSRIARDTDFHLFAIPAGSNTAGVVLSDGTSAAVASTVAPYGNAWQLREYNTARRAEAGDDGANWDNIGVNGDGKTYSDVAIEASKGYELRSGSKYYREYLFPVTLPTAATSVGVTAATGAAGAAHAGWNILCSPYTDVYIVEYEDNATGIKVSWQYQALDGSYSYIQVQPEQIKPAVPFAYQASQTGALAFDTNFTFAAPAPRKQSAAEALTETEWVHLDIFDAYGEGDETSLFVHPTRFEQTYKTGIDVAKQSLTAARPIIYSTHAYGDMAFAGVADSLLENGIDIAVYSPSAQELTFSLRENKFLNRLEYLWLADNETGERTDLLMDDYTCRADAGTIKGRFVLNGRFKAPQISTGIGNTQTDYNIYAIGTNIAISGVEQGTPIYVFDAVGHMIYTTAATSDEVIVPAPCAGVYMLSVGGQTAKLVINQ